MTEKKLKKKLKKINKKLNLVGRSQVRLIKKIQAMDEEQAILQAILIGVGKRTGLTQDDFLQLVSQCIDTVREINEEFPTEVDKAVRAAELLAEQRKGEDRVH